ncbi:MAG: hypothetical protein NT120_04660 [Candidatus Aenigmarchaeota archaeon]|nr:hypothetical protein [Candidatus Aenigmarchaeota archaeon]
MDDRRALLEYLPYEASELIGYKPLSEEEIRNSVNEGKIPIWIDDKKGTPLSHAYMEEHFLGFVNNVGEFHKLCSKLASMERQLYGVAVTRYNCRIPGDTIAYSEDLAEDQAVEIRGNMELYASGQSLPPPKP